MARTHHDELRSFLEWRRQTRFIRHYGGPIAAVTLCVAGLGFAWRACHSREPAAAGNRRVEEKRAREVDHHLQATKMPKW